MVYNTDNKNLYMGISEKKDGSMKGDASNSLLFFKNKKLDDRVILSANLVHGNKVAVVDNITKNQAISKCDALISNNAQQLLSITVADCLPIYFFDKKKKVIALAHAGWRGVLAHIVASVVDAFVSHYDSDPKDIAVYIGPHIRDCHFAVKSDVASQFSVSEQVIRGNKIYINLAQVVKKQLLNLGIDKGNISQSSECTYCEKKKYFSFRRDKPQELETMIAYIALK